MTPAKIVAYAVAFGCVILGAAVFSGIVFLAYLAGPILITIIFLGALALLLVVALTRFIADALYRNWLKNRS